MGSLYLLDLGDVCRSTGYPVIECDGWEHRARGSGGYNDGEPGHVIVHHTASGPSADGWGDVNYCLNHPDAPVGNLYLARDGTVYVMAGGAANTNGTGSDLCGIVPDDGMNSRSIAIEAGNDGVGEPWADLQQDSYVKLCSALCTAYSIGIDQIHSHAEWAPGRKIDPAGPSRWASSGTWPMNGFRADVAGDHHPAPGPIPPTPGGDVIPQVIKGDGSDDCYAWDGVTLGHIPDMQWIAWGYEAGLYQNTDPVLYPQGFIDQLVEAQGSR